jgi:2-phosphosulfolactate phosphatase
VVVIDVLRAFSTAAYAFAAGVNVIHLVSKVEDAFALKEEIDYSRIMGEVDGLQVDGFDYGNSPAQFDGVDLSGIPMIQRTTSGTQGVVESIHADKLFTASFCNADATVWYIDRLSPLEVNFVITGKRPGGWGDEDQACADYIQALLSNQKVDPETFLERVRNSTPGRFFRNPDLPEYPLVDLEYCLEVNKFEFTMPVSRSDQNLRMKSSKL